MKAGQATRAHKNGRRCLLMLPRLTLQISDPAPLILDCQPERYRRVRCIWLVRPTDCHGYLCCNWETACGVAPPVGFVCPLVLISAAPIMLSITPAQRSEETCSCRKTAPATVATTKPSPVRGHRKLMSAWVIRTSRQAKKTAWQKTPSRIWPFVAAGSDDPRSEE